MQLRKESLKKIRLAGIRTLTSAIPLQRSNQLSYQANWELVVKLVRNIPGMKIQMRNEAINVKKILAVVNATYAVAKRKPEKNQPCRDSNPDLCDTGAAL